MSKYTLFGETITFSPAEERYLKIWFGAVKACVPAGEKFDKWYKEQRNIENVLDGYEKFSQRLIVESLVDFLYNEIISCDIYDISKENFISSCFDTSYREEALETVENCYLSILRKQEGEEAYRRARKAGRGKWQGGGFGLSGAMKGAVQAGAINAVTGLGHSVVNAIGNAGSATVAASSKKELYHNANAERLLRTGVIRDFMNFGLAAIELIEKNKPECIHNDFDIEKAIALFENAKRFPKKREELLIQAFKQAPTDEEILTYIFVNHPKERKEIYRAAKHFGVDISAAVEEVFDKEYTEEARESEDLAREARVRILVLMQEYGITECRTLDQLETDGLTRLCKDYEKADETACKSILSEVKKYEAAEKNKETFITMLNQRIDKLEVESLEAMCKGYESADETTCNTLVDAVNKAEKKAENKKVLLDKLQTRIEEIWSVEDGEIFDNLYLKTDIANVEARNEAIQYIKEKGRTSSSGKYIKALESCTDKNIGYAREYQEGNKSKIYNTVALSGIVAWLINLTWITAGTLPAVLVLAAALICLHKTAQLRNTWKLLTIDGTVLHPVITKDIPERAKGVPFVVYCIPVTAVLVGFFFAFRALIALM